MAIILFIALIAIPIVEISLFIQAGEHLGLWPTLAAVIGTAILGTALMRQQGLGILMSANRAISEGRVPLVEVFDGVCVVIAGALLLTPGFLTDAIGLALLIPPVRHILRQWLILSLQKSGKVEMWAGDSGTPYGTQGSSTRRADHPTAKDGVIIEGEYEPVTDDQDNPKQ
ncbi:MAG: FxsA family protein [Hyphomicrobiales bacterium]|nr:FxsA family protein [Hyphomicrobiales bacterium]